MSDPNVESNSKRSVIYVTIPNSTYGLASWDDIEKMQRHDFYNPMVFVASNADNQENR